MSDHDEPTAPEGERPRSRWALWGRRLGIALIALELVYLVAGNLFLHTEAGRSVINRKPEKVHVGFEGAWTLLPGVVRVRGLEVGGSSRRVSWSTRIDRGWTWIWLPSLATRHVHIVAGRQRGVEVDIDLLPKSDEPRATKPGRGWTITLGGLRADSLRHFRVDDYLIEADGSVRGWARFQVRGPMELRIDRVAFENGAVHSSGREVAGDLSFDAGFTTQPWRVKENTVEELLAGASGHVELESEVDNLEFLEAFLRKLPWLGLDGSGELALAVRLDRGAVQPGSEMALVGEIRSDFYDFRAHGDGRIDGRVESADRGLEISARLDAFELDRQSDGQTLLTGEGFETGVTLASPRLDQPPEQAAGTLKLASARSEELSRFAPYLPAGLGLELDGGTAELSLELSYDTAARTGGGRLDVELDDLAGAFQAAGFTTSGTLAVVLSEVDLLAGRFGIDGTVLELRDGSIESPGRKGRGRNRTEDWTGTFRIPSGRVVRPLPRLGEDLASPAPVAVEADVRVEMADTAPVVVLMEQRLPKLRFVQSLLTVSDVELAGHVALEEGRFGLHQIEVSAGRKDQLEILLDLDLDGPKTSGAAYARYRALAAAVDLQQGDRNWSILRPKRKYEEAVAGRRAARGRGAPGSGAPR